MCPGAGLATSMHVTRRVSGESDRLDVLSRNTVFRYLFGIVAVAIAFALRTWLAPLIGAGGSFLLFFAAVLVTSLLAGMGPGVCAALVSMPLGAYMFAVRGGYPLTEAVSQ